MTIHTLSRGSGTRTSTDNDPKFVASFLRIQFPETTKLRIRGFTRARKNSCRTCHYGLKCCKALWLQARKALWSNCQRTQPSQSRFFLCKETYELLFRSLCSLRSNKAHHVVFIWRPFLEDLKRQPSMQHSRSREHDLWGEESHGRRQNTRRWALSSLEGGGGGLENNAWAPIS